MQPSFHKPTRGFTLMESVIAIGVVAVLLTTFMAVFGPATKSIRGALNLQDANRLQSALERELQILRVGSDDGFATAFDKAFDWILKSGDSASAVVLYNYRGDPNNIRPDGTLTPYPDGAGESGVDYIVQPGVRRLGDSDTELKADLEAVEGGVYLVRMTQMVFENGELRVRDAPGVIGDPHKGKAGAAAANAAAYPEAVIAVNADFYSVRGRTIKSIQDLVFTTVDTTRLPKPLISRPLGVRR